jgi:hypothetical protein
MRSKKAKVTSFNEGELISNNLKVIASHLLHTV